MKQRNFKDCGICSLAMFLGKSYAEINRDVRSYHAMRYGTKFDGICDETERAVLWKHGAKIKHCDLWDRAFKYINGAMRLVPVKRPDVEKLVKGKKAILSVPSVNFKNKGHAIFWDGKKLHDPSNLKRYTPSRAFKRAYRVVMEA